MKTQKTTILLACAAIACAAVLAGCTKSTFGHGGEAVTFATTSSGSPATRTAYGADATVGNDLKQALNWQDGDAITISSPQAVVQNTTDEHASNYKLTDITAGVPSTAKVQNESANGLMWLDEVATYDFYGVYPKVGTTPTLDENGNVTATIVADQTVASDPSNLSKKYLKADGTATTAGATDIAYTYDVYAPDMSQAYMTAAATKVASGKTVKLSFEPAFTAFEINLTSADDVFSVSKVTLSAANGEYLAGGFAMTAGATEASGVTSGIQSVYFQPETAIEVTQAKGFTATLFTLPKTNTGALTLQVQTKDGDATSTATLKLTNKDGSTPYTFTAGHKYRINMLKIGGKFNFKLIDLKGVAIEWKGIELTPESKNYPEATQFEVEGANNGRYYTSADQTTPVDGRNANAFRQYWLMKNDATVVVKFKIMSPIGYDWLVVPSDTEHYTVTSNVVAEEGSTYTTGGLRGPINTVEGQATTTNVILYIKAKSTTDTAEYSLYLNTYVVSRDDKVKYSLDSETQLYDIRGYHYFILNNSTIVK